MDRCTSFHSILIPFKMGLKIKLILLPLLEEKFSQKLHFTKPYRKQLNIPVKGTM